ncbi:glycerol-3-phosphate 1-O-acyltransferase PlsY [Acetobacter sp. DsW_063]|uniref:glycerol-3-phosphate 1-O-acyltransferase PlsY n=1 Tax=Acetobacter sp. DsW_063 TaxID=1514894 RepID=UPI000A3C8546|nr:glycerol-3-phosphate 1-O-acyltransferase PlsY [Acetobacter sp. DsW_063]OUJ14914.1 glycerol-3-phosphate acyltransferase [Acetobacter sp. DsW_063]
MLENSSALLMGAIAFLSYLLGSVPFGLVLTALSGEGDIRKVGSGNIGATNVLRTGRKDLAAATLALDAVKGAVAVAIAWVMTPPDMGAQAMCVAAVFAVLGHCFPLWLGFKGGKGVATGLGAVMALSWPAGLAGCAVWLLGAKLTRISSAGALLAFAVMPLVLMALAGFSFSASPKPLAGVLIAVLIFVRHHANIARLLNGTEPRIGK